MSIYCPPDWSAVYIVFNDFEKLKNFPTSSLNILANMSDFLAMRNSDVTLITVFVGTLPATKIFADYSSLEVAMLIDQ